MKIVALMRIRDEMDLLPKVIAHLKSGGIEEIFAYDDDSKDGSREYLENHPMVSYLLTKEDKPNNRVYEQKFLQDEVIKRYGYDDVWIVICDGDFFYNKVITEAVKETRDRGYDCRFALVCNFVRHGYEGWPIEIDTWPNYDIINLCNWISVRRPIPVIWKLEKHLKWGRLPRVKGYKNPWFITEYSDPKDLLIIKHYGKRSPNHAVHKYTTGDRVRPKGLSKEFFSSRENVIKMFRGLYKNTSVIPWHENKTPEVLVDFLKMSKSERGAFHKGINFLLGIKNERSSEPQSPSGARG